MTQMVLISYNADEERNGWAKMINLIYKNKAKYSHADIQYTNISAHIICFYYTTAL